MGILKGALVGAIILFVWGLVAWRLLPFQPTESQFRDGWQVARVIEENISRDGVYVLWPQKTEAGDPVGPYFFGVVRLQGKHSLTATMIGAFISLFIAAAIVSWMILQLKNARFGKRLLFVTLLGVVISVFSEYRYFNWAGFPLPYTLVGLIEVIIGWFLAGLALAKIVRS